MLYIFYYILSLLQNKFELLKNQKYQITNTFFFGTEIIHSL